MNGACGWLCFWSAGGSVPALPRKGTSKGQNKRQVKLALGQGTRKGYPYHTTVLLASLAGSHNLLLSLRFGQILCLRSFNVLQFEQCRFGLHFFLPPLVGDFSFFLDLPEPAEKERGHDYEIDQTWQQ